MGRGGGRRGGVAIIWHLPTEPKLEVSKDVGERRNRKGRKRKGGGRGGKEEGRWAGRLRQGGIGKGRSEGRSPAASS